MNQGNLFVCCISGNTNIYQYEQTALRKHIKITDKHCAKLIQLFGPLEARKNEHFFQQGSITRYVYYVESGYLGQYYISEG